MYQYIYIYIYIPNTNDQAMKVYKERYSGVLGSGNLKKQNLINASLLIQRLYKHFLFF